MSARQLDAIAARLAHVSTGAAPGCSACGLDGEPTLDELDEANTPHFGRMPCEACGNALAGDRHPAHAVLDADESLVHLDVCTDCVARLNGLDPEPEVPA